MESRHSTWHHPGMRTVTLFSLILIGLSLSACSRAEEKACKPPRDYWRKPHDVEGIVGIRNEVSLRSDGAIYWNGTHISPSRLTHYLEMSHQLNPEPEVFLQAEMGVTCSVLEDVRDRMDRALDCRKSYSSCDEGVLSMWQNLPVPPGTPPS